MCFTLHLLGRCPWDTIFSSGPTTLWAGPAIQDLYRRHKTDPAIRPSAMLLGCRQLGKATQGSIKTQKSGIWNHPNLSTYEYFGDDGKIRFAYIIEKKEEEIKNIFNCNASSGWFKK
ncbi:hypothetical protein QSE00_23625 [Arenibacter sp. M-2]|uniref:hypothetical protein n=1 Tax=Arenibacter sp. M-2 TaxID=3053612 RepID=UPI00256FC3B4|nr:hypothetical protein [Arenibacter sp. M-2]MDL5514820.1 hypothetical protein [Arenibacter sp. M-2]